MKKYNFNLETVLSIRENIEKEWEAKLGHANNEVQLVKNRIDLLNETLQHSLLREIDVCQFETKCIYEDRLNYQINKEKNLLKEREIERDRVKEVYLQKSIDRKIIDKLKEKSLKKYKKELLKEETMIIDELNSASNIRKIMLGGAI